MSATLVTDLLFEAKPRWAGTIGAGGVAAAGTTTIPLSSAAELDNGDAYIMVINRVTPAGAKNDLSDMETVIGELSGTNLINCVRGVEGTAQAYDAGTVVEILFTATHWNKLIEAWETEHNQDGTHSVANMITEGTVKDEDDMASDSATALVTQQSVKAYVDAGWYTLGETMTYASADDPTYTATVSGVDLTSVLSPGMRMRVEQSTGGTKYFIVTKVAFSTDTTITLYGGTDYNLEDEAISNPKFAVVKAPVGFPLEPDKWTIAISTVSASTDPDGTSWYNLASNKIDVPIGSWNLIWGSNFQARDLSGTQVPISATLSTSSSAESDAELTCSMTISGATGDIRNYPWLYNQKIITISSKTTYYLLVKSSSSSVDSLGILDNGYIRAVCAYL